MSYPVRSANSAEYANQDLQPMRDAIANGEMEARRKGLRPVQPKVASNPNNLAGRDLQHLSANAEASPVVSSPSDPEDASLERGVALAFGAAALAGTAATYAYDWFMGSSAAAPINEPPAALSADNVAPPVNIFLPRNADAADLEAIRLAGLTEGDAEIARRLADEDAQAAADAKRLRDEQIAADLKRAQFSQKLYDLAK